jgi:hypothetical protein
VAEEIGSGIFGRGTLAKFQPLLARCGFPINYETLTVDGPLDCDLQAALSAKKGLLQCPELPFVVSLDEAMDAAMKSSALWSLRSNAQEHELVARITAKKRRRDPAQPPDCSSQLAQVRSRLRSSDATCR